MIGALDHFEGLQDNIYKFANLGEVILYVVILIPEWEVWMILLRILTSQLIPLF
jgi:hypothetical protein